MKLDSKPEGAASYLFGGGSYEYDPNHSILAMAKKGYEFSHWEYNGTLASGIVRDPYSSSTSVNLDGDKELTAFFKSDNSSPPSDDSNKLYLLSVYSSNITQGTANGSGFFRGTRTIKAIPKEGFIFSHWEGAELISNAYDEMAQVIVSENLTVTAHFQTIGLFEDSNSLENGWWGNPWFGYFWKVGDEDWLFHENLGWIFMKKKGDNSIWVWIQKMNGWFWTAKEHYPYLYSSVYQNWYYVNLNQSNYNKLIVYNYLNSTWESW